MKSHMGFRLVPKSVSLIKSPLTV